MQVALYLRASTEEQNEENQLSACKQFCEVRGWQIVHIYKDRLSAYQDDVARTDYEACKRDARAGKFQHIVVWALDRWTRQGIDTLIRDLNDLSLWGVQLHSVQDSFLDESLNFPGELGKAIRNFLIQLTAAQAKAESQRISDRVKAAYYRKREAGELGNWGRRPIELDLNAVRVKYDELGSLRKTAQHFGVSHEKIRNALTLSEKGIAARALKKRINSSSSTSV